MRVSLRLIGLFSNLATYTFLLAMPSLASAGESCGSKEGYFNQLTSMLLIPDYFPPETPALRDLVSNADYERCQRLAIVPLAPACDAHDGCYDAQLPKDQCDREMQDSWVKSCRKIYWKLTVDHYTCRLACEAFVKLMSEAQRYNSGGICPSCEAYNSLSQQGDTP